MGYRPSGALWATGDKQRQRALGAGARGLLTVPPSEVRVFDPELTDLQRKVLRLIGAPASAYLRSSS